MPRLEGLDMPQRKAGEGHNSTAGQRMEARKDGAVPGKHVWEGPGE